MKTKFVVDWTGTLVSKQTRLFAPHGWMCLKIVSHIFPNSRWEILSIAKDKDGRREEISKILEANKLGGFFNDVKIIEAPKRPQHFKDADYDNIVVIGDRYSREIANGKIAGALTLHVGDPEISISKDLQQGRDDEGKPYDGKPHYSFASLKELAQFAADRRLELAMGILARQQADCSW